MVYVGRMKWMDEWMDRWMDEWLSGMDELIHEIMGQRVDASI